MMNIQLLYFLVNQMGLISGLSLATFMIFWINGLAVKAGETLPVINWDHPFMLLLIVIIFITNGIMVYLSYGRCKVCGALYRRWWNKCAKCGNDVNDKR